MPTIFILAGIGVVGLILIFMVLNNLLCICRPDQVLIFSGSTQKVEERTVNYRLVKGGRSIRKPIIERVDMLDLTNMMLDVKIRNAYSKGGIPLSVDAVANVKIDSTDPIIHNAIERLLGKSRKEIMKIAKETLEGNLRGVLATMTPEQVNEDKAKFQEKLVEEADRDLQRVGLKLDTLNIQNISDDMGYLDSIGRIQSAEIQKLALIAEAQAQSTASIKGSENHREISLAKIRADRQTAQAEADRRIIDATTRRTAVITEQKSQISAEIVKAQADVNVQKARLEQVRRKLAADVIEPSRANMEASISEAIGKAAHIIEDGKATAQALEAVTETWQKAGSNARDIFLLQKVELLFKQVLQTVNRVEIDQVTLLPGNGQQGGEGPIVNKLVSTSEQIKSALGVDLPQLLQSFNKASGDQNQ